MRAFVGTALALPAMVVAAAIAGCGAHARPRPATPTGLIAYQAGKRLMVSGLDGRHPHRFATLPGTVEAATFSPDGSRLLVAFQRRPQKMVVAIVNRNGKSLALPSATFLPDAWSPDGRFVATDATTDASYRCQVLSHQLYLGVYTSGGRLVRRVPLLTAAEGQAQKPDAALSITSVAWSPDGTRLAYVVTAIDCNEARYGFGTSSVGVLDVRDGSRRTLYRGRRWAYAGEPAWSPSGSSIAFATGCNSGGIAGEGCAGYAVAAAAGGRLRAFEPEQELVDGIAWTPDGRVVYASDSNNDPSDVGIRAVDARTGRGGWVVRARTKGAIADAVGPYFELSRDRTELITSVVDSFTESTPDGYSALVVTSLDRHKKWVYPWRNSIVGVFAGGFRARP